MKADLPHNERDRLQELAGYHILDTPPEADFDAVTRLAASICRAPIAVVNLIAEGRQWFKSEVGLGVRETPLESSFCAHAILQNELLVVTDPRNDPRFADNPLVTGEPHLRFYAGSLLQNVRGYPLGTLCVLDYEPRDLDEEQRDALEVLSTHVMNMLELRRNERRLRSMNENLQAALAGRQRVMATVAHDLRSPLSVIALGTQLLQTTALSADVAAAATDRIKRAVAYMEQLVGDLLDLDASDPESLMIEPVAVDLAKVVRGVSDLMTPLAEDVQVTLSVEADTGAMVLADENRLYQVMTNLVGNALKFTPEGGRVKITLDKDESSASVCVVDSGMGIDAASLQVIFDPFVRVNSMNTRGAGLGLAISKRIIEAHRGSMDVESTVGEGSVFCFSLPLHADGGRPRSAGSSA